MDESAKPQQQGRMAGVEPPLIVRLPNWIGDVVMALPALRHLHRSRALVLLGRGWAAPLLAGTGWRVETLAGTTRARIAQWRALGRTLGTHDALLMTNSFSSAFEARCAGMRATGFSHDGRGWLLRQRVRRGTIGAVVPFSDGAAAGLSIAALETLRYDALATAITHEDIDPVAHPVLPVCAQAREQMLARLTSDCRAGPDGGYVVLVPFATGALRLADGTQAAKQWPGFVELAARLHRELGLPIVLAPGPDEFERARDAFAQCCVLPRVPLDQYAALLQSARLVVANDTGPGHVAAAVGAPLVSVLGPTDPVLYGARGPRVHIVHGDGPPPSWPAVDAVLQVALQAAAQPA